jgi:H+-transporting ATPase
MPSSWRVILEGCFLAFCVAVLSVGKFELRFGIEALGTLSAVAIVHGSQATIYALRAPPPSLGIASDLVACSLLDCRASYHLNLAFRGIAMAPLPLAVLAVEFVAAVAFGLIMDYGRG